MNTSKSMAQPKKDDTEPKSAPMDERLFESRQIQLNGPVDDKLATRIVAQLLALEAKDAEAPITMFVNSPGGSVTAGFAIYDVMRFIQPEIRVVCAGLAASIATVVLLGAPKDKRFTLPNTRLLIHQPMLASTVYGPASDLEITANEMLKTRKRINDLLVEETGQPEARIEEDTQRDFWMTAEEAVSYGLISRIVRSRDELSKS